MKKIAVYDFDRTLVVTPDKTEENLRIWQDRNPGAKFGSGWFGNVNSLCPKSFDIPMVGHVKEQAMNDILDPDTHAVLLTGRITRFESTVKDILRINGVPEFNEYHFSNQHGTLEFKLGVIRGLFERFPSVDRFEMWEDRIEHIPHFVSWGVECFGSRFQLHEVRI
jgi:hypothetical protein